MNEDELLSAFDHYTQSLVYKSHPMTPEMWPKSWPFFKAGWDAREVEIKKLLAIQVDKEADADRINAK
jgi:hypothetical protein